MKKMYYFFTKHSLLTAFMGANILWIFFSYNNLYERFNNIDRFEPSISSTVYNICSKKENFAYKSKELEEIFKETGDDFSVTVLNKKYGKIYEKENYKPIWYKKDSFVSYGFSVPAIEDVSEKKEKGKYLYEYVIKYQYKYILPVALLRLWSFSIIPNYNSFLNTSFLSLHLSLKLNLLQSLYFWITVLVFYCFLSFYKKELNI